MAAEFPSSKRTINGQASYESQLSITTATLSFQELLRIKTDTAIKINQHTILTDYMRIIKDQECIKVTFTDIQARKYAYKPKLLANAVFGNTNYYALILRLNYNIECACFHLTR